jgi:phage baseplate assembly protein W
MLILTSPGERMMDPDFGVGLRRYLFRAKTVATTIEIKNNIQEQIDRYLSVISLTSVDIDGIESPGNKIFVRVNYFVPSLGQFDILEFKFDTD